MPETVSIAVKKSEKPATGICNRSSYVDCETQTVLFEVIPEITSLQKHVQSVQSSIQSVQDN